MTKSLFLAAALLCLYAPVSSQAVQLTLDDNIVANLELQTKPEAGSWTTYRLKFVNNEAKATTTAGYVVTFLKNKPHHYDISIQRPSVKGGFTLEKAKWTVKMPLARVAAVWDTQVHPADGLFRRVPEVQFNIDVRPNLGVPLSVVVDQWGNNVGAFGFLNQERSYKISGKREGSQYILELEQLRWDRESPSGSASTSLWASVEPDYWFETANTYCRSLHKADKTASLDDWFPQYSTRYPFEDKIDQKTVADNAAIAAQLGARQVLIDVGWSSGNSWSDSGGDYGTYTANKGKFNDFAQLVEDIKGAGADKVTLWAAPTWVARGMKDFDKIQDLRMKWPEGEYDRNLCVRNPEARQYIVRQMHQATRTYNTDGWWLDFLDTFYDLCDAPHNHDTANFGEGLKRLYTELDRTSDYLEFRIPFANLLSRPHATIFETTWSPEDYRGNRLMGINARAIAAGLPVKTDPVYWGAEPEHEDVARHLMTSIIIGQPAFSGDLVKMSQERRAQIKGWLDYWKQHRDDISSGKFLPFGANFHNPDIKIESPERAYIYLSSKATRAINLSDLHDEVHILNSNPPQNGQLRFSITGLQDGNYTGTYYDCFMKSDRKEKFSSSRGVMPVSTDMPTGGLLVLKRD